MVILAVAFAALLSGFGTWTGIAMPGVNSALLYALWMLCALRAWQILGPFIRGAEITRKFATNPSLRIAGLQTAIDGAMPFWAAAILISTLANLNRLDSVVIGLYFVAIYILIWYLLAELLQNGGMTANQLLTALQIGGMIVVLVGMLEILSGGRVGRITATLENPNRAGYFYLLLLFLHLRDNPHVLRLFRFKILHRLYTVVLFGMLLSTGSRGALLGLMAGSIFWLAQLHRPRLALLILLTGVMAAIFLFSLRGDSGRLVYWQDVLTRFQLTGSGLFTYRHADIWIPARIHAHAHNALIEIGYELGALGLVAAGWSLIGIIRRAARRGDLALNAALVAAAAHHLVDFPAQVPALAIVTLVILGAATYDIPTVFVDADHRVREFITVYPIPGTRKALRHHPGKPDQRAV